MAADTVARAELLAQSDTRADEVTADDPLLRVLGVEMALALAPETGDGDEAVLFDSRALALLTLEEVAKSPVAEGVVVAKFDVDCMIEIVASTDCVATVVDENDGCPVTDGREDALCAKADGETDDVEVAEKVSLSRLLDDAKPLAVAHDDEPTDCVSDATVVCDDDCVRIGETVDEMDGAAVRENAMEREAVMDEDRSADVDCVPVLNALTVVKGDALTVVEPVCDRRIVGVQMVVPDDDDEVLRDAA